MLEGKDLFQHIRGSEGDHDTKAHLAEMIALLGPPPKALFDPERVSSNLAWTPTSSTDNKLDHATCQYIGAPFFNSRGKSINITTNRSFQGKQSANPLSLRRIYAHQLNSLC